MASGTQTYIETRGFHLRGFVGGALVGCCGAAAAASAPAWPLDEAWRTVASSLGWAAFTVQVKGGRSCRMAMATISSTASTMKRRHEMLTSQLA